MTSNYKPQETKYNKTCKECNTSFMTYDKDARYCSIDCGARDKLLNKYHCPVCNKVNYDLHDNPYCSREHKLEAHDNHEVTRVCDVCGSTFFTDRFTYTCSDYCEEHDDHGF